MATQPDRLLLRGFPHWLTTQEKESLLKHFGATEIVVMPTRGKMRNAVFATFATHEDAKRALGRLHQVRLFQSRLVVEYAQDKHTGQLPDSGPDSMDTEQSAKDTAPSPEPEVTRSACSSCQPLSSQEAAPPRHRHPPPPPPPRLHYHYPPPTPSTLTNITNTLACVPKFYVQVLHLMNLLNLPPPFGPAMPTPPLAPDATLVPSQEGEDEEEEEAEAESEIESDEETKRPTSIKLSKPRREVKHRTAHVRPSKGVSPPAKRKKHEETDQFDQITPLLPAKKIELHVPSEIKPHPQDHTHLTVVTGSDTAVLPPPTLRAVGGEWGGEGRTEREEERLVEGKREEEEEEEEEEADTVEEERMSFITSQELKGNRISKSEMRELSVFRGYSAGEPSLRLYLKNLAKQVTEQDLRYIYGRYVNWSSEEERNIFDIRLMQTGRMKGQAFVGLPSEEAATAAVRETNGYLLAGRPMVVHFARTAKPNSS